MTPRTAWDSEDGLYGLSPDGSKVRWISHVVFGDIAETGWVPREHVEMRWGPLILAN